MKGMGSSWHNRLSLSIFGQSHAPAIGMTLDGLPPGEAVDLEALNAFLKRRAPGRFPWSTPRKEEDIPEVLSGIVNGKTCGAPLAAIIRNQNTRSGDYTELADIPRPGHADYTAHVKYGGFQDLAGGGHFSGRLTAALCIAGGICLQILARRGIFIGALITCIGGTGGGGFHPVNVDQNELAAKGGMDFPAWDNETALRMIGCIEQAKSDGDSIGGMIQCAAIGLPPGLGDPIFGGMENRISSLVFGIPAVKGIQFGAGFSAAWMSGSEHNDPFCVDGNTIKATTNHHGGILGGITSGMPLIFQVAIKPTPSISKEQESIKGIISKEVLRGSFTSDAWSSKGNQRKFVGITFHYLDEQFTPKSITTSFARLDAPHTAIALKNILGRYNVLLTRAFLSDYY